MITLQSSRVKKNYPGENDHACPWPGCGKLVHVRLWGCRKHWFSLPQPIRRRILEARHPWSLELEDNPPIEYRLALQDARDWLTVYAADTSDESLDEGPRDQ